MKTLILPGYSARNKEWAEETQHLLSKRFFTEVMYWNHWTADKKTHWVQDEVEKIQDIIENTNEKHVNIIAKSIGTYITMHLLQHKPSSIHKLVLCGIPLHDLQEGDEKFYFGLRKFSSESCLCIQNQHDPHGTSTELEEFFQTHGIKLDIKSKPRDDHHYPFSDDFIEFLS